MGVPNQYTASQGETCQPTDKVSKEPTLCKCGKTKNEEGHCDGSHKLLQTSANKNNE